MNNYDLELDRVIKTINKERPKTVLIQLPDGLKPEATNIVDELEEKTKSKVFIYFGTCYGACDVPNIKDIDLLIQFGHSAWKN